MRWLNLAAYKPSAGAGVASTPIDNAFQAIMDAVNGATVAGAPVASASTIPVTNPVHAITGTVTIANISDANSPTQGETVTLWIQNGLTIQNNGGGTGNIRTKTGNDRVLVANEIITFMYDGAVWREEGPSVGAAITGQKVSDLGSGYDGAVARLRVAPATFNNGGATALPAATLTVGDTAEFASAGTLDCGANGTLTYTGKTATTFTGCTGGTGTLGALQTIRQASVTSGVANYENLALIYDAVLGKWVSTETVSEATFTQVAALNTWADMTYITNVVGAGTMPILWRKYDAAGLKPQVYWIGDHVNGTSTPTLQIRVQWKCGPFSGRRGTGTGIVIVGADAASAGPASVEVAANPGDGPIIYTAPWSTIGAYTVNDVLYPWLQAQATANAGGTTQLNGVFHLRWVG